MYDLDRVVNRMNYELSISPFARTLKETGYDMTRLGNDYYTAILKALLGDLNEDDRLLYFVIVVQEILKLELQIDPCDVEPLWQDTWQIFENLVRLNINNN